MKDYQGHYELLYIVGIKYLDEELDKAMGRVDALIAEHEGTITSREVLGRQKLAYPIKGGVQGTYVCAEFNVMGEKLLSLNKKLGLLPELLRHLIISKKIKTEKEIAKEKRVKEKLLKEKEAELEKLEESAKNNLKRHPEREEVRPAVTPAPAVIAETPAMTAEPTAPIVAEEKPKKVALKKKADKDKISLEDLDKKLDEILTEEVL